MPSALVGMMSLELNIANELDLSALENLCLFLTKSSQSIAWYFMAVFVFSLNHTNINYSRIRQVRVPLLIIILVYQRMLLRISINWKLVCLLIVCVVNLHF